MPRKKDDFPQPLTPDITAITPGTSHKLTLLPTAFSLLALLPLKHTTTSHRLVQHVADSTLNFTSADDAVINHARKSPPFRPPILVNH